MKKQNINTNPGVSFYSGIFILSLAVLCFEVLASRITSIIFIHNYAFMVVSLAILGIGCGGIFVFYRWKQKLIDGPESKIALYSSLFSFSVVLFVVLITAMRLTANRLFYFLILFPPFFFAGVVLSLAFRSFAHRSFKLYASDLLGAASGSLLAIWVLKKMGGANGILFVGVLGSVASFFFIFSSNRRWALKTPAIFSFVCLLLFLTNISSPFLSGIPVGRYPGKEMYNMLNDPVAKAEVIERRWSAFGRTDLVGYQEDDSAKILFIDGGAGTAMYKFNGDLNNPDEAIEFLKVEFSGYFPFLFLQEHEKDDVLIIGPGGGKEILLALLAGVKDITGVEINRDFVDIVKKYKDYNGGLYTDFKNVNIAVDEGRSFLRGSDRRYDIIMFSLPITNSLRSFEGYALAENYLLTVEAIKDYFNHLTEEGRIILVLHNPYEIMRFVVTALTALEKMGIQNNEAMNHIYSIGRGVNPVVVLKKNPLTLEEAQLRHAGMHFLRQDNPSSSFLPHIKQQTVLMQHKEGQVHEMKMFNDALIALSEGSIGFKKLITLVPLDISPATDNKPFFFNYMRGLPPAISSLLLLVFFVNFLVIVVPAPYKGIDKKTIKPLLLFMLLGAGFMLIEISFFQRLILFLGSATVSLSVLLTGLLAGMGIGSFFGERFYPNNHSKRLKVFSSWIFISGLGLFFTLPLVLNYFLSAALLFRVLICLTFLIPLGFILGVPFPTAISLLKERGAGQTIAWMYGINGTMSVLGSVGAVAISLTFGFATALTLGTLCYFAIIFIKWSALETVERR